MLHKKLLYPPLLGTLILMIGCGGGGSNAPSSNPPAPVSPSLTAIVVLPPNAQVSAGAEQQFTASGKYSDGSTKDLTTSVTWNSSAASVASMIGSGTVRAEQIGNCTITASQGSLHGSAVLSVTPALLTSISITPAHPTLPAGTTLQLQALGTFGNGSTQDLTHAVTWVTTTPDTAAVSPSGLLQGLKAGVATVVASQGLVSAAISIAVSPPALVSLALSPARASIAQHTTLEFSAQGTFTDGSTQDLTTAAAWTSATPAVATVSAGLVSGLTAGTTTITAASGAISASAILSVTNATAVSVTLSPANPSLVVGLFQQFTALASFNDGTTQDITGTAAWASSAPNLAACNSAGLVAGLSPGAAVISASFEQVTGSSNLSVQAPSLVSISISPENPSIANTTSQPFFLTGYYNDGSTQALSNATWSSSNPAVAGMNGNAAVSAAPGMTTITATFGAFSASTSLSVTSATLQSIAVIPINATIAPGTTESFFATGSFSDGTTQDLTGVAAWRSSNTAVAAMNQHTATALSGGTSVISASFDSVTASTGLNVTQATLASLALSPVNPVLVIGAPQQFTATGTFSDRSTQDMTSLVTWHTSQPAVAAITSTGLVTGQAAGTTTISATYGSATASTNVSVTAATLRLLAVTPATASMPPGTTLQFSATGTYSDGTVQRVTSMARWTSSNANAATVGNVESSGQVASLSSGWTRISAVLNSVIASAVVNVNNATLVSLAITPANPTIPLASNQQLAATGTFSDGSTQDLTPWVSWSSSSSQVCVVNSSGYATGSGSGTATITATFGSVSATTAVTVY